MFGNPTFKGLRNGPHFLPSLVNSLGDVVILFETMMTQFSSLPRSCEKTHQTAAESKIDQFRLLDKKKKNLHTKKRASDDWIQNLDWNSWKMRARKVGRRQLLLFLWEIIEISFVMKATRFNYRNSFKGHCFCPSLSRKKLVEAKTDEVQEGQTLLLLRFVLILRVCFEWIWGPWRRKRSRTSKVSRR